MASRLSDESQLITYDQGLSGFTWSASSLPSALEEERSARTLLDSLLSADSPTEVVQSIEPSLIRHALLVAGIEDHLEILPLLSSAQVTHIMDFEAWKDSRISVPGAIRWLQLHKQASSDELLRRFRELEEEFQTGLLGPFIETYDLEMWEKMSDQEQDALVRLPCGEVFYKIKSDDPETRQFVEELVNSALSSDIEYAYSLLAHASYLPPNEQESIALQFRNARLEEEGFVTADEASTLFITAAGDKAIRQWTGKSVEQILEETIVQTTSRQTSRITDEKRLLATAYGTPSLIDLALPHCEDPASVATRLAHLANTVASASGVESDDRAALKLVLTHTKGHCNLGLELLSGSDPLLASRILSSEHPGTIFKASFAVVDALRRKTITTLAESGLIPAPSAHRIQQLLFARKYGQILLLLDRETLETLGVEANEVLKALFNRFPLCPAVEGEKMTFQPVHERSSLVDLAQWSARLQEIGRTLH
jgi:hypothetical protein